MSHEPQIEAPPIARITAALIAAAFCGAAFAWGSLATMSFWAPTIYRLQFDWRDVIPGTIACSLLLIAFQFARGALVPEELPWGIARRARRVATSRYAMHIMTAVLLGVMGALLWTRARIPDGYARYDRHGGVAGYGDPIAALRPVLMFAGAALIIVACIALVTRTRRYLAGLQS